MNNTIFNNQHFNKALFFALKAHGSQEMKYPEGMPYSMHFVSVAMYALKYSMLDKEKLDTDYIVQVALLHDTIEDTSTTYEEVKMQFGERVANGVLALSKNRDVKKSEQMADCIKRIKALEKGVAIVKMADRLFNIRCRVPSWSKDRQEAYKEEAKVILNELGYACAPLKAALYEAIENY